MTWNLHRLLLMLIAISCSAFAQLVEMQDYNVAVSRATTIRFDGTWNFAQTGDKVESNNATGSFLFDQFLSSLPLAWGTTIKATGGKNFDSYNHDVSFNGNFKKYVWNDADWFGKTELAARHMSDYKQVASNLFVGFGIGRYIEATPLAKAVRIEDHLIRDGIVTGHLPKSTMLSIAGIIERENEYKAIYSEQLYENAWIRDIENEIQKSDSLKDESVGALGVMRMRQVLFGINERVNKRYYGWDVSLGFQFEMTTHDKTKPGAPSLSLNVNYALPIGWVAQVTSTSRIATPVDSAFGRMVQLDYSSSLIYELNNRINFVSTYTFTGAKKIDTDWALIHNLYVSFWYYVENNTNFIVAFSYTKAKGAPKNINTNVGLQYNFY
ncbi:MAG: hypothetical protein LWX56_01445 [Ignavibacteria bacterium]|nr:hypothetical protein [Ignavibacteria bacterium]